MKVIPFNIRNQYLGLACKLSENAHILNEVYRRELAIGYDNSFVRQLQYFCENENLLFVFISEEQPIVKGAETFYCVAQVGGQFSGDWWWFSLAQLVIQDNTLTQTVLTDLQEINAKIDALNAQIKVLPLQQRKELEGEVNELNLQIVKSNKKTKK